LSENGVAIVGLLVVSKSRTVVAETCTRVGRDLVRKGEMRIKNEARIVSGDAEEMEVSY